MRYSGQNHLLKSLHLGLWQFVWTTVMQTDRLLGFLSLAHAHRLYTDNFKWHAQRIHDIVHCKLHYVGAILYLLSSCRFSVFWCMHQCSPDMVKDGGGAVILLLTSAQYLSGMPTAFSSASFRCLISSSFLRLHMIVTLIIITQITLGTVAE